MVLRTNKITKAPFLGCSLFPRCSGRTSINARADFETFDTAASLADQKVNGAPRKGRVVESIKARWPSIVQLAAEKCGGTTQGERWLETPKMALDFRMPIEVLATHQGCDQVEALLQTLWDDA